MLRKARRPSPTLPLARPDAFKAVIIMDLMGGVHWEPLQQVVFAAGAEKSPGLYARVKEASGRETSGVKREARGGNKSQVMILPVGMHLIEEIPLLGRVSFSDYDAFRNANIPFLFLSSGRTPRYHQTTDLPNTLHYERMAGTVGWLNTLIRMIDEDLKPYSFEPERIEFADELAILKPLVALAANGDTRIPNTSFLSLWKMQGDHEWLQQIDPIVPTQDTLHRLERTSIRMQCLLADYSACFLI